MDYSKLTDAELEAIANDDYTKLSAETLQALSAEQPVPEPPGMLEQAGKVAGGVAGTAVDIAKAGYNAIPYKELVLPYAGYKALPHVYEGAKRGAQIIGNFVGGATTGPVNPIPPGATSSPSYTVPSQPAPQPSPMQAAKSIVQKLALSKLLPAAQLGAGLLYTSPEEIATLKAAEARRKAQGQ